MAAGNTNYGFLNERSSLELDPIRNFRFLVKFIPLGNNTPKMTANLGFTSVSGLGMNTAPIPYREGGMNTTLHMIPGQSDFTPVTMQRGVTLGASQHWSWLKRTFDANGRSSEDPAVTANFRCDVRISVLAHPVPRLDLDGKNEEKGLNNMVALRYRLRNAWPTSVTYSDLNAGDSALLVEGMTLVHEGLAVDWPESGKYLGLWNDGSA